MEVPRKDLQPAPPETALSIRDRDAVATETLMLSIMNDTMVRSMITANLYILGHGLIFDGLTRWDGSQKIIEMYPERAATHYTRVSGQGFKLSGLEI